MATNPYSTTIGEMQFSDTELLLMQRALKNLAPSVEASEAYFKLERLYMANTHTITFEN